jgi:ornithine decarboxylase
MYMLKVAVDPRLSGCFINDHEQVDAFNTDFTDVGAIVVAPPTSTA